ncbi:MAG: cell division protein FtsQ/DivIB [Desulfomonilia bacterium]
MVSDYKQRVKTPSKKKTLSQINLALRVVIWLCLGISGALITFCAIAYISNSEVFLVKEIAIKGNTHVEKNEVLTLLDLDEGDNILSWDMNAARKRLQKHPWIKDITLSRSFVPASLSVCIQEHKPTATLILKDKPYLISEDGQVFISAPDEENFGLIIQASEFDSPSAGEELHDILKDSMSSVSMVEAKGLAVKDLVIESGGLVNIRLQGGITLVIFGEMTPVKIDMALKTIREMKPAAGTIMDLTCDDKIVLRNRGVHGSEG